MNGVVMPVTVPDGLQHLNVGVECAVVKLSFIWLQPELSVVRLSITSLAI